MAQFSSGNASFTPAASTTTLNNWVLTALTAGQLGRVKKYGMGGNGTTSVGYQTRWSRVNNTAITPTALLIAATNPGTTPTASCNTYATVATGVAANNLDQMNWNVLGGGMQIVLPIGGEWQVVGGALGSLFSQIGCGNVSGVDANLSSYSVQWEE